MPLTKLCETLESLHGAICDSDLSGADEILTGDIKVGFKQVADLVGYPRTPKFGEAPIKGEEESEDDKEIIPSTNLHSKSNDNSSNNYSSGSNDKDSREIDETMDEMESEDKSEHHNNESDHSHNNHSKDNTDNIKDGPTRSNYEKD